MDSKKILTDEEVEQAVGGLSSSEWKELEKGATLYLKCSNTGKVATLYYTGDNRDPGFLYEQELRCIVFGISNNGGCVWYNGDYYSVGMEIWVKRGSVYTS